MEKKDFIADFYARLDRKELEDRLANGEVPGTAESWLYLLLTLSIPAGLLAWFIFWLVS